MKPLRIAVTLCALSLPLFGAGYDPSDSFAGAQINSCNWEVTTQDGSVSQNNGLTLMTTGSSSYGNAAVRSQYTLIGDFDIVADFTLLSGFDAPIKGTGGFAHLDLALRIQSEAQHAISLFRTMNSGGSGFAAYTTLAGQGSHNSKFVSSSATSGSLRLTRRGPNVVMWFRTASNWIELDQISGLTEPVFVSIAANNIAATNPVQARITNFQMLSGRTSSRPFTRQPAFLSRSDFHLGGVVTDYLAGLFWGGVWTGTHPLDVMKQNGFDSIRMGMLTTSSSLLKNTPTSQWTSLGWHDEFWSSKEYTIEILKEAAQRRMRLTVFLFFSDQPAYAGRQKAPPEWANLTVDQEAAALESYTFASVTSLIQSGVRPEAYDLGNEIDNGFAGWALGERIPYPPGVDVNRDFDWMRANVWNIEATLLKAAARGVRLADPNAKITLHVANLTVGDGNSNVLAFTQAMIDGGVDFDNVGLSLPYPTYPWPLDQFSTDCWFQRLQDLFDSLQLLGKKVIISEASYPNDPAGEVAGPMKEFPFTTDGQAAWFREHLRFLGNHPNVIGFNYFYPDHFRQAGTPVQLQYSGLFITDTQPAPAMSEARIAAARLTVSTITRGQSVSFTGSLTGPVTATLIQWNFGDGTTSSEITPVHTYAAPGTYTWRLTADTDAGRVYTTGTVTVGSVRRRAARH